MNVDHEPVVIYEQSGMNITSLAQNLLENLLVVTCEDNEARLSRIDQNTGESLGFFDASAPSGTTIPHIDLPDCMVTLHMDSRGRSGYRSGQRIYWVGDSITSIEDVPSIAGNLYWGSSGDFIISGGAAVTRSSDRFEVAVTHAHQITAIAILQDGFYVSAACGYILYAWAERYCAGVDMALSQLWLGDRESIYGHSNIVRHIIRHETLDVFVSLSEDGTIILWGAPVEPQPVRRGTGARLFG